MRTSKKKGRGVPTRRPSSNPAKAAEGILKSAASQVALAVIDALRSKAKNKPEVLAFLNAAYDDVKGSGGHGDGDIRDDGPPDE
ncbi:MAG: hypothetical protein U0Q16_07190 [Bryobacteraceae bacterium]